MNVIDVILGEGVSRRGFLKMLGIGAGSVAAPWSSIVKAAEDTVPDLFSVAGNGSYIPVKSIPTNAVKTSFGYVTPIKLDVCSPHPLERSACPWMPGSVYDSIIYDKSLSPELTRSSSIFTNLITPIKQGLADGTLQKSSIETLPNWPEIKQSIRHLHDIFKTNFYPSLSETFKSPERIRLIYGFDINSATANTQGAQYLRAWIEIAVDSGHVPCPEVINLFNTSDGTWLMRKIENKMAKSSSEVKSRLEKTRNEMEEITNKDPTKAAEKAREQEIVNRQNRQRERMADEVERYRITRNPHATKAPRSPRMDWAGGSEDSEYNAYSMASESKRVIDALVGSSN
jgi:hypothetical protein